MSEIKNSGLDQYGELKALTGLAVKGLTAMVDDDVLLGVESIIGLQGW